MSPSDNAPRDLTVGEQVIVLASIRGHGRGFQARVVGERQERGYGPFYAVEPTGGHENRRHVFYAHVSELARQADLAFVGEVSR